MIEKQNWFMDLFYDNEVKKMIESKVDEGLSFSAAAIQIMKIRLLETDYSRTRVKKLKTVLKSLLKETDKKIALVGHGGIFSMLVSEYFTASN